jgi:hypothetical protein
MPYIHYTLFSPETDSAFIAKLTALNEVGDEDVPLVESVQRGLQSARVPQGRLVLGSEGRNTAVFLKS